MSRTGCHKAEAFSGIQGKRQVPLKRAGRLKVTDRKRTFAVFKLFLIIALNDFQSRKGRLRGNLIAFKQVNQIDSKLQFGGRILYGHISQHYD